jgi:probable F420-dependent oxidoreductase
MRVGLNLPNYGDLGTRDAVSTIADTAEELGFASLWTTDHVLLPSRLPEPYGRLLETLTTLSYLAARTERIGLATSVLVLPQRDPLLVAKQAATIQHLSGGRLTLGVGVGWVEEEFRYLRADYRRRGRLADEYIAAMRELFEADLPSFKGPSIEYDDVLFSPRPEAPLPIVVGGASKAALTRAATLGDGWHGIGLTAAQVRGIAETLRSNPLRPGFEISLRTKLRLDGEVDGAEPGAALFGSVESVVEGVRAYTAAGVDHLVIEPVADRLPDLLDQLSAFAREVLPVVVQGARS